MKQAPTYALIEQRRDGIRKWLDETSPYITADQKHLDAATPEQAYWHYGYERALSDVLVLMTSNGAHDNTDIPN